MRTDIPIRASRSAFFLGLVGLIVSVNQPGVARVDRAPRESDQALVLTTRIRFETDVLPIFKSSCIQCHGPDTKMKGLNLSNLAGVMKGGESGAVIVPGKPDESVLYRLVQEGKMPKAGKPLSQDQLTTIKEWIVAGAPSALAFETGVLPILKANCVQCHGPETQTKSMNLSTYAGAMKGSESGAVVVPGQPEASLLYQKVSQGLMPKGGKPLSADQVTVIRQWIEAGAPTASHVAVAYAEPLTEHDVLPIMFLRCTACHGMRRQDGGLDLHTRDAMLKGGKSGPALAPGKPNQSLLVQKLRSGEMPPKKGLDDVSVRPITPPEIDKVVQWIAQGAPEAKVGDLEATGPDPLVSDKDRQFWSFCAPKRPAVPAVKHPELVRNPIDAFLLSKLEAKGLSFSPEAEKLTLIRRAAYDLTGLPPAPSDVQAYLADKDPKAYDHLIDRLLASPRYGERWARNWLDLAGYSDSEGGKIFADNVRPYAWRYRDYVIQSFNNDKPYDRFLVEQLAGDELTDYEHAPVVTEAMMDNLVATGFLRMGPDSTYDFSTNSVQDRLDVVADEMEILGSGVMGLTIKCARCHSHKYDPIPQRDYDRMVAVFKGAFDYYNWLMPQVVSFDGKPLPISQARLLPYIKPGATPVQLMEQQQAREVHNEALDREIKAFNDVLGEKAEPIKKAILEKRLGEAPVGVRDDLRKTLDTAPEQRTEVQKYLADKFGKLLKIEAADLKQADAEYRRMAENTERQIKLLEAQKEPEPRIRALWDQGNPTPTYVMRRGDPDNPGPWVGPGVPAVLTDGNTPFVAKPPWPGARSTGRRLAFAKWLTQPDHPLTARVMMNRIWAGHLGAGIVKTLGNFGHTGAPPTHPELVDWLATEFVRQGWSIKGMHRLIMTSTAYRQSSVVTPTLDKLDPDNMLVSRMPMRRMEAEEIYDTLLLVSGKLDEMRGGPPEPVDVRDDGLVTPLGAKMGWRRSIYVQQRRSETPTLLDSFDLPAMGPNCLERNVSTVAIQALHLMNNPLVDRLAASFAERLRKEAGTNPYKEVEQAYWIALGRPPTDEEQRASLDALSRFKQAAARKPAVTKASEGTSTIKGGTLVTVNAHGELLESERDQDAAALTEFCHSLVNSAAFLYID